MTVRADILLDSFTIDTQGRVHRITTIAWSYPLSFHAQVLRDRRIDHSVRSARAVPLDRQIEAVKVSPFIPASWTEKQRGMTGPEAGADVQARAFQVWTHACAAAVRAAEELDAIGVHQQDAARLLAPFQMCHEVVTFEQIGPFLKHRISDDAQPVTRDLARATLEAMRESKPKPLAWGEWHVPCVDRPGDEDLVDLDRRMVSAARCARVSFVGLKRVERTRADELARAAALIRDEHMSPFTHQRKVPEWGWMPLVGPGTRMHQFRWDIEGRWDQPHQPAPPEPGWVGMEEDVANAASFVRKTQIGQE